MNDTWGMNLAQEAASHSRDESRKSGCALVLYSGDVVRGCNHFPPDVKETPDRLERPAKYAYTEHAERNAIYKAARKGMSLAGATAYLNWYPCADCARALALVGVVRLVCYEPDWTETRYGFHDAKAILEEGGVIVEYVGKKEEAAK